MPLDRGEVRLQQIAPLIAKCGSEILCQSIFPIRISWHIAMIGVNETLMGQFHPTTGRTSSSVCKTLGVISLNVSDPTLGAALSCQIWFLHGFSDQYKCPMLFIGHSLGSILVMQVTLLNVYKPRYLRFNINIVAEVDRVEFIFPAPPNQGQYWGNNSIWDMASWA